MQGEERVLVSPNLYLSKNIQSFGFLGGSHSYPGAASRGIMLGPKLYLLSRHIRGFGVLGEPIISCCNGEAGFLLGEQGLKESSYPTLGNVGC